MANKEINIEEMRKRENPKAYQDALIFRTAFQQSKFCIQFRKAWKIPEEGFKDYKEYEKWNVQLIEDTNAFYKSKKYKNIEKKKEEMRKVNDQDLNIFCLRSIFVIPLLKFNYDVDNATLRSGKPVYFRDYIEECLLFKIPRISFPTRPLPEPKLQWDFNNQFYNLTIENIFPDTTSKDFDNKKFTEALEKLKTKLPGYGEKKTRVKKNVESGLNLLEIDAKNLGLDDFQKFELLTHQDLALEVDGKAEQKIKNNVRQNRLRVKKYLSKSK
jgi:hypothetical protein